MDKSLMLNSVTLFTTTVYITGRSQNFWCFHTLFLEPHPSNNSDFITGLEWQDQLSTNRLSNTENRRLRILLTKMAHSVRLRDVVLRPYFQDYELVIPTLI